MQAIALAVFALFLCLVSTAGATGAPSDIESSRSFAGSSFGSVRALAGVPVTQLDDGGFLAFEETAKTKTIDGDTYVLESRVVSVRKYSSGGKVDRKFDRSKMGRGLVLGRKREIVDVRKILRLHGSVYLAWATTNGYTAGSSGTWERAWVIAFSGKTGRLIPTFGEGGVIRYGASPRKFEAFGTSVTEDVTVNEAGRIAACGSLSKWRSTKTAARIPDFTPFVLQAFADSRSLSRFFSTGKSTTQVVASQPDHLYKACHRVTSGAAGAVYAAGLDAPNRNLSTSQAWIHKYRSDGTQESSFGNGGEVLIGTASSFASGEQLTIRSLFVGPDEKLYVVGAVRAGPSLGYVARLLPSGAADPEFGEGGITRVSAFIPDDGWLQPDGKVVLSGRSKKYRPAIGRIDQRGNWDENFANVGWRVYPNSSSDGLFRVPGSSGIRVWGWWTPRTGKSSKSIVVRINE